jgi:mannose-6-phosphate isomerase-like protein (cupin superfamily)
LTGYVTTYRVSEVMSFSVTQISELPSPDNPVEGLDWRPVRHHLGITAFGANAYAGRAPGDLVIEDHDEDEFEELYVVVSGAARFEVDGEAVDAPAGTLVLVTPPSRRVAHATAPDTTVFVVGAVPGKAYEISEWETRYLGDSVA